MKPQITLERVYADPQGTPAEGFRVYVDRLWPRGESKALFHYDLWAKEIAPSTELRQWLHQDPATRWPEFVSRYTQELAANPAMPSFLDLLRRHPRVVLLYSSHDTEHNNARVLAQYLAHAL